MKLVFSKIMVEKMKKEKEVAAMRKMLVEAEQRKWGGIISFQVIVTYYIYLLQQYCTNEDCSGILMRNWINRISELIDIKIWINNVLFSWVRRTMLLYNSKFIDIVLLASLKRY